MVNTKWWKNEVVYQVYPRSFQDTNNDGIGDLNGITQHLDYLKQLGVTMLWISPVYRSPMVDMGYDIADYQAIDPQFGTMADFDHLLAEAKKRGLKIIMDLVVNHTSDQHMWFKQALADPQSKYRDYYIFKTPANGQVPNNWRSIFGGSTWTEVPGEPGTYYFHTFAPQQPDLNWENPQLRKAIYQMINWWLDKGISGFRVDAITHLKKDLDWASIEPDGKDGLAAVVKKGQNRPGLAKFLLELKAQTFDRYDALTVGEAYGVAAADLPKFIGPNGYFSMMFDFSYLNIEMKNVDEWYRGRSNWTVKELKTTIFNSQQATKAAGGWSANVLESHDQQRTLSKLVPNPKFQTPTAAKALATMYYFLPGVPFIYQGQELGMKNFRRQRIDQFKDISSLNNYQTGIKEGLSATEALAIVNFKSRDNARTPMQWTDATYGGFSTTTPWLEMGNDRAGINVAAEEQDPASVLNYYRQMVALRFQAPYQAVIVDGAFEQVTSPDNVIAYRRRQAEQELVIAVNLGETAATVTLPKDYQVVLSNVAVTVTNQQVELPPYAAVILTTK
ncbi:alpha-glucosidase [Loigolactobacillus binensis]|uniref:Alpha-glucosidase n=1 Tax=Loigolactobacillus binensis TaxID=2559922 RepID=A0ABW3EDS9_9LACO|nr:alpha-glucosidase [Loigolactobacillus binensis]